MRKRLSRSRRILFAFSNADGCVLHSPTASTVRMAAYRTGLGKRRWRHGFRVLGVNKTAFCGLLIRRAASGHVNLVLESRRADRQGRKLRKPMARTEIGLEKAVEFLAAACRKTQCSQVLWDQCRLAKAIGDGVAREARIVLFAVK